MNKNEKGSGMRTPWFANRYVCHAGSGKRELYATIEFRRAKDDGEGWDWRIESEEMEESSEAPYVASGREKTLAKAKSAADKAFRAALSEKPE